MGKYVRKDYNKQCPKCSSEDIKDEGTDYVGGPVHYKCNTCRHTWGVKQ